MVDGLVVERVASMAPMTVIRMAESRVISTAATMGMKTVDAMVEQKAKYSVRMTVDGSVVEKVVSLVEEKGQTWAKQLVKLLVTL